MGELRNPQLVTPIVAILAGSRDYIALAKPALEGLLGPIEFESPVYPFDKTEYYVASMGQGLFRLFFSFKRLADPGSLAEWKLMTNSIEHEVRRQVQVPNAPERPINLDVGYISGAKLVLASTKDFSHRIYLRNGIFAEITMGFRGDHWVSHQFTFPDFKSGMYDAFLKKVRDHHLRRQKEHKRLNSEIE